jgi:hypothetical protein
MRKVVDRWLIRTWYSYEIYKRFALRVIKNQKHVWIINLIKNKNNYKLIDKFIRLKFSLFGSLMIRRT